MTYHHTVDKLIKLNKKIEDHTKAIKEAGLLPEDLEKKAQACQTWFNEYDEKISEDKIAEYVDTIDPVLDYSTALGKYKDIFEKNAQSEIVEFEEYVKELFEEYKGITSR